MKHFFFIFFILISSFTYSQENVVIDKHVTVNFNIKNLGFNVEGSFKQSIMSVVFNENDLSQSSISGEVSVKSIDTDIKKRDEHLKREDYFDAENHPKIIFKSSKIILKSKDIYNVTGDLTIKNTTKEITVPFTIKNTKSGLKATTGFEINRRDYKIGSNSFTLSDIAKISITYLKK